MRENYARSQSKIYAAGIYESRGSKAHKRPPRGLRSEKRTRRKQSAGGDHTHDKGGAKRKCSAIEPHREKWKRTESSGLIEGSRSELSDQKAEQSLFRIGNALRESFEIYHREGFGVRLPRRVRQAEGQWGRWSMCSGHLHRPAASRSREERHGCAGASEVGRSYNRDNSRTSALLKPASFRGASTANSAAAFEPGRRCAGSSPFSPYAMAEDPRSRASAFIFANSSAMTPSTGIAKQPDAPPPAGTCYPHRQNTPREAAHEPGATLPIGGSSLSFSSFGCACLQTQPARRVNQEAFEDR